MEIPDAVKRAFIEIAASTELTADDKLVVAVYLAHGIGRLPEATEENKFQVTDTKVSEEDAQWWGAVVATMNTGDEPNQLMNWLNLGPSVESKETA